jgi:ribonuclease T2
LNETLFYSRYSCCEKICSNRSSAVPFLKRSIPLAIILTGLAALFVTTIAPVTIAEAQGYRSRDDRLLDRNNRGNYRNRDYRSRDRFRDDRRRGGRDFNRSGGRQYGSAPGRFDFYVLALSWSPNFCASEAGKRSRQQCRIGAGNRFVVHGLWPQYDRGSPSYCSQDNPPRSALAKADAFPEEGLARYQWRKHGSCSGLSPSAYFDLVRKARDKVVIPPALTTVNRPVRADPDKIEKGFLAANRQMRPDNIAVTCVRGQLQEVRICMSKDLRSYVSCPEVDRRACRSPSVDMLAPR